MPGGHSQPEVPLLTFCGLIDREYVPAGGLPRLAAYAPGGLTRRQRVHPADFCPQGQRHRRRCEGSAQNRANLYAKRFRVGACWIGAGIDRYEDEPEILGAQPGLLGDELA